jgi:hypothetical protein
LPAVKENKGAALDATLAPKESEMARYQIVDLKMANRQIQGRVYAESDNDTALLQRLNHLRTENPEIELVMIDTWKYRQPVA